jgi:DNA-binding NarL/FixJ family response regulator
MVWQPKVVARQIDEARFCLTPHDRLVVLARELSLLRGLPLSPLTRKVLVVDDHPIVREGITLLLTEQHDLRVCGSAYDIPSALQAVRDLQPDVALIDLSLGSASGLELIGMIAEETQNGVYMLALSMHDEALYAKRVLHAGGHGYIMKHEGTDVLLQAIRTVLAGQIYVSPSVNAQLLQYLSTSGKSASSRPSRPPAQNADLSGLSNRELQIYRLVGQGVSTKEIARRLFLSVKTVESHRANIKQKLGVGTAAELVAHAVEWHVRSGESSDRLSATRLDTVAGPLAANDQERSAEGA